MRKKTYVIAKGLPGQAILKDRAMAGEAVYNWHFMNPTQLASEVRQSYGIKVDNPVLSQAEAAFFLLGIMKNKTTAGNYFKARSISDMQVALGAINRLRMQLTAEEEELVGLKRLLAKSEEFTVIQQKNDAILTELAEPYLKALEEKKVEDSITLMRKTILEAKKCNLPLVEGKGWLVEERPLAPLERELVQIAFAEVAIGKEESFLGETSGEEGTVTKFTAYGASNEVRRIMDEIRKDGKPLDQYLIACANPSEYEPLFSEYEDLAMTIDGGVRASAARVCRVAEKMLNWHRSAYTRESFQELADQLDSLKIRKKMMEDGIEEKDTYKVWKDVVALAKQLYFSLDTEENGKRLTAYEDYLKTSDEKNADSQRKAAPYCRMFVEMLTVRGILQHMIFLRDGDMVNVQGYGIFMALLKASEWCEGQTDIERLPAVLQVFEQQSAGGKSPEAGKVHLCSWNKANLYRRPVVYMCGLQNLTGSISENATLLDGDIELVRSRVENSDLVTTSEQIRQRSEDLQRIVEYLKKKGIALTLSWSNYSLNELKKLSVPALLNTIEAKEADRAGFQMEDVTLRTKTASDDGKTDRGLGTLPLLTLTPSSAERMLKCPYYFMMTKLLHVNEPENDDSQTSWLDAAEKGTLCHSVFEHFVQWDRSNETKTEFQSMTKDEIYDAREKKIFDLEDRFLKEWEVRKPDLRNKARTKREVDSIVKGFLKLWDTIPDGAVEMAETDIEDRPIVKDKLQCHGIPDLVMNLVGQGIMVLDYKTGSKVKHKNNDVISCAQTLLYCMMLEQKEYAGKNLGTYYLYPLVEKKIGARYDNNVKKNLEELFTKAIAAMETGDNWLATDGKTDAMANPEKNPACDWCKMKPFCTRKIDINNRLFRTLPQAPAAADTTDGKGDDSDDR